MLMRWLQVMLCTGIQLPALYIMLLNMIHANQTVLTHGMYKHAAAWNVCTSRCCSNSPMLKRHKKTINVFDQLLDHHRRSY